MQKRHAVDKRRLEALRCGTDLRRGACPICGPRLLEYQSRRHAVAPPVVSMVTGIHSRAEWSRTVTSKHGQMVMGTHSRDTMAMPARTSQTSLPAALERSNIGCRPKIDTARYSERHAI